jgi:hypothetical protein
METTHSSPAEVTNAIETSLASLPEPLRGKGDRAWTMKIKEVIGSLGEKYGWDVCTSGFPDRFDPEWLYDLIWFRNDSDSHLSEVYLVMESEWGKGRDEIKYDFEKLLLAKATLKVMVFQTDDKDTSGIFNFLKEGIHAFQKHSAEETYILAAFNNNTFKFEVSQINGA